MDGDGAMNRQSQQRARMNLKRRRRAARRRAYRKRLDAVAGSYRKQMMREWRAAQVMRIVAAWQAEKIARKYGHGS